MIILASIVLILGGIVWWCSGSWAARVVATVLLVPFGAYSVGGIVAYMTAPDQLSPQAVAGIILGGIGGWFLAWWPSRYWERQSMLRRRAEIVQWDIRPQHLQPTLSLSASRPSLQERSQ